jgi:hypothetical protein
MRLECLAFSSSPALIADKNRFSRPAFVACAGDIDTFPLMVLGVHRFALGGFVGLSYLHSSDESRLEIGWQQKWRAVPVASQTNVLLPISASEKLLLYRQEVSSATK